MNAPTDLRLPPHSIEAEQSVLGGLLLDNRAWDRIADLVSQADFYRDDHRRIFRHIAMLCDTGKAADVVTVAESMERSNETELAGGLTYLGEIANNTPSAANIRRYAEIVRERAALRKLIGVADSLAASCFTPGGRTAQELAGKAEAEMLAALDSAAGEPSSLAEAFAEAMAYVDNRWETGGLVTGFRDFDGITGGLEPGQLVIIAARPSVGKTIIGCNVADHVARAGGAVLLLTLEMTRREIGMRILAARSGVSVHAMRAGTKEDGDWDRMSDQYSAASQQRLWIDDTPAATVSHVRAKARRLKRKLGQLDLIVIDYLQLMRGTGDTRTQEIGSISRGLKALAKELMVPVIALAQLNRNVEGRTDKRPMMSDLRDSGELEQDADIVAMLHRESIYSDAPEWADIAELLVRKNRNGPTGDLFMTYRPAQMRFADHCGANPRRLLAEKRPQKPKIGGFD
ncbi:MAG: replicative DNA helicase [Rhodocyclaceae bacterium]|nr:MAG: replicative DNA helicase [Rhodocyclaceae bacterium]